jgi:hypothetical protein
MEEVGIFCGHLVYFKDSWYNFSPFGISWYSFPRSGKYYQQNLATLARPKTIPLNFNFFKLI